MKRKVVLVALFVLFGGFLQAQDLTLGEVLSRYYQAGNFEKLGGVKTIVMTGTLVQQDLMPVKIYRVRPDKYLMEYDVADLTAYQGYDGEKAWFTAPWTGSAAAQPANPDRTTDLRNRADFDGILVNLEKKGHKAELEGTDTVNDQIAYKIKVTRKDGGVEYNLVDVKNFMLLKRVYTRLSGGKEVTVENTFRDYRKISGIPFAFVVETNFAGRINEIQFDDIALDGKVEMGMFRMPEK